MGKRQVGEIRISKRVVRIGHEVYPLANISRVRTLRLVWSGRSATFYPLKGIAVTLALVGALAAAAYVALPELDVDAGFNLEEAAGQFTTGAAILGGVRIVYLLGLLLYRLIFRRRRYALVIETAGTQFTALSGTARDEIHRIEGEIVSAIEDPPDQERIVHVGGDLVLGDKVARDKYEQRGADSRITVNG
ncbi:hypothetical protein Aph01nite_00830 [Acrocarpospora phusangensis]|uniref:Uncharacterized protein n=1 Tax=Acrocarpospora phusangensis TaxID=1070424 RepID=A0A919Q4J0_9ACTN|nr:DUF6232 family protein [Acrocarpospora phusangensis]GIH21773.1 hypothetical protein Aph01nite_00830 [Acrocarpospora phusangensis]